MKTGNGDKAAAGAGNECAEDATLSLDNVAEEDVWISDTPDAQTALESIEADRARAEVESLRQDTDERKRYALLFFNVSCAWIVFITVILLSHGTGHFLMGGRSFYLSDQVLLAVIGATTANILGILYVVAHYLFPKR